MRVCRLRELPCWRLGWPLRRRPGGLGFLARCSGRLALRLGLWAGAVVAEIDERHFVGNDFYFGFFLACRFVFPSLLLEAAINVDAQAFGEELAAILSGFAEDGDIDKIGVFVLGVLLVVPDPIEGQADVANGGAFGSVADFGVAGEVS